APFLSATLRFDTSDSQIEPRKGVRVLFQNDFAGRLLGGKTAFYRWTLDLRSYRGIFRRRIVLAGRALVQQISGSDLPIWELSALGGGAPQSAMRGYVLNRFMDKGKFLVCGEVRLPVWKRVGAVVFAEAGLVWPSWKAIEFRRTAFDAGFGLRYRLSNFVARGDIGFSREGSGVYFNFGHMF
ncbi:MAG TPA: BamA/TamA family outer membrane protein, partial [Desulfobaccales bacterium]|nr:BamA/TamA family outer membrane protein [Desulfobaccales bacterium]